MQFLDTIKPDSDFIVSENDSLWGYSCKFAKSNIE